MPFRFVLGTIITPLLATLVVAQDDFSVITAYQTDQPPTVDGTVDDGEWDAAGDFYVISVDETGTQFPEDPFGGPSDLSYRFKAMWEAPWTAYFLFEVTDDIDMETIPENRWEMDQVEFLMDGDDLDGNADPETFRWWDNDEIFGKFGASRWEGEFEGNTNVMSTSIEDLYTEGFGSYAVAVAGETGESANYVVEYAISLEAMFDHGTFDDTSTGDAEQIVADETAVKWTSCVIDNDNFGDGTTGRSHALCSYRNPPDADWRDSTAFADLVFTGPFDGGLLGDFDNDGDLDDVDIDALTAAVGGQDLQFDVSGDGSVTDADRTVWVKDLRLTWFGDANLDGEFNTTDLVTVFQIGKFEKDVDAGWGDGDFDGDGRFSTTDFVKAFQDGGFEKGPRNAVAAVPEPSGLMLLLPAFGLIGIRFRRR